jgi:hypothetical protein
MKEKCLELQKQTCIKIKTRDWYSRLWCTIHLVNGSSLNSSNTKKHKEMCDDDQCSPYTNNHGIVNQKIIIIKHSKTQANNDMYLNPKNIIPYTI